MRLYLNIPFEEKDEAKKLGARWDAEIKKWYIQTIPSLYYKFEKWILRDREDTIIASECLYIIEGYQKCWNCGKTTKVIALGVGEHLCLYLDEDDKFQYLEVEDYVHEGQAVHLAWVDKEKNIPPKILRYLKHNYKVKTVSSLKYDGNFANFCEHCDAIQSNWYLFEEIDSPFMIFGNIEECIDKVGKLKVIAIPIDEDLLLDWNVQYDDTDFLFLKYGKNIELNLSTEPDNEYVSYKELYS